jgi:Protein of unknown function (DUF3237)
MIELIQLCTVAIDLAPSMAIGTGPAGDRSVGEIRAVAMVGERLNATLTGAAAADWLVRTGAVGVIDARMTLKTFDDALIYLQYGGRLDLSDMKAGITAYVAPVFETGDERYAWLNRVQAVGKGKLSISASGAELHYEFYEVR